MAGLVSIFTAVRTVRSRTGSSTQAISSWEQGPNSSSNHTCPGLGTCVTSSFLHLTELTVSASSYCRLKCPDHKRPANSGCLSLHFLWAGQALCILVSEGLWNGQIGLGRKLELLTTMSISAGVIFLNLQNTFHTAHLTWSWSSSCEGSWESLVSA